MQLRSVQRKYPEHPIPQTVSNLFLENNNIFSPYDDEGHLLYINLLFRWFFTVFGFGDFSGAAKDCRKFSYHVMVSAKSSDSYIGRLAVGWNETISREKPSHWICCGMKLLKCFKWERELKQGIYYYIAE